MYKNLADSMIKMIEIIDQQESMLNDIIKRIKQLERDCGCCCPAPKQVENDLKETKSYWASWRCPVHGRITIDR